MVSCLIIMLRANIILNAVLLSVLAQCRSAIFVTYQKVIRTEDLESGNHFIFEQT